MISQEPSGQWFCYCCGDTFDESKKDYHLNYPWCSYPDGHEPGDVLKTRYRRHDNGELVNWIPLKEFELNDIKSAESLRFIGDIARKTHRQAGL